MVGGEGLKETATFLVDIGRAMVSLFVTELELCSQVLKSSLAREEDSSSQLGIVLIYFMFTNTPSSEKRYNVENGLLCKSLSEELASKMEMTIYKKLCTEVRQYQSVKAALENACAGGM